MRVQAAIPTTAIPTAAIPTNASEKAQITLTNPNPNSNPNPKPLHYPFRNIGIVVVGIAAVGIAAASLCLHPMGRGHNNSLAFRTSSMNKLLCNFSASFYARNRSGKGKLVMIRHIHAVLLTSRGSL